MSKISFTRKRGQPFRFSPQEREQLQGLTDAQIEAGADSDADTPSLGDAELRRMHVVREVRKVRERTSLKEKATAWISRLPERHIEYLTVVVLPFLIYGYGIYGVRYPLLTTALLVLTLTAMGIVRAVRFPGLWDAIFNLCFGWATSFAVATLVQTLHPHLGTPASWRLLGWAGGFFLSAPAFVLTVIRITDGPAFSSSVLKRRLLRQLVVLRGSRRRGRHRH